MDSTNQLNIFYTPTNNTLLTFNNKDFKNFDFCLVIKHLLKALLVKDCITCLKIINDIDFFRLDLKKLYSLLVNKFSKLLINKLNNLKNIKTINSNNIEYKILNTLLIENNIKLESLVNLLEIILSKEQQIYRSNNPKIQLEFLIMKITILNPIININDLNLRLEIIENKIKTLKIKSENSNFIKNKNQIDIICNEKTLFNENNNWQNFKEKVKKKNFLLWSRFNIAQFISLQNKVLEIGFPKGYIFFDFLKNSDNKQKLIKIASKEFFQEIYELKLVEIEYELTMNKLKKDATVKCPFIKKIISLFEGAKINQVIIKSNDIKKEKIING